MLGGTSLVERFTREPEAKCRTKPVPPVELLFDGSRSAEEFKANGEGFTRFMLVQYARLQPTERVLDIGCGNGQKARALTKYLGTSGSDEGVDINLYRD